MNFLKLMHSLLVLLFCIIVLFYQIFQYCRWHGIEVYWMSLSYVISFGNFFTFPKSLKFLSWLSVYCRSSIVCYVHTFSYNYELHAHVGTGNIIPVALLTLHQMARLSFDKLQIKVLYKVRPRVSHCDRKDYP